MKLFTEAGPSRTDKMRSQFQGGVITLNVKVIQIQVEFFFPLEVFFVFNLIVFKLLEVRGKLLRRLEPRGVNKGLVRQNIDYVVFLRPENDRDYSMTKRSPYLFCEVISTTSTVNKTQVEAVLVQSVEVWHRVRAQKTVSEKINLKLILNQLYRVPHSVFVCRVLRTFVGNPHL